MACPKCGCKTTYHYCDGGDDIGPADDEDLERCAACGHIFFVDDHADEDDDLPETQPGTPGFDGADAWNAYGA